MSETVSFKVYLAELPAKGDPEVRRFVVDREVSTSFTYFQEKLIAVYPRLRNEIFSVNWTDIDGDKVTITNDEELIIALTEMTGPLYKLNVVVKGAKKEEPKTSGNTTGEIHPGVSCDGCDKTVVGFRYKCMVCDDYDLCGSCDAAGLHPGHNMMRISSPEITFPQHFFKRLHKMQERAQQRSRCRQEKKENEEENRFQGMWGEFGDTDTDNARGPCRGKMPGRPGMGPRGFPGHPGRGGMPGWGRGGRGAMGGCGRGMFGGRGGWNNGTFPFPGAAEGALAGAFDAMMKGWMGQGAPCGQAENEKEAAPNAKNGTPTAEEKKHTEAHSEAEQKAQQAHHDAQKAAQEAHEAAHKAAQEAAFNHFQGNMNSSSEYLKNVGNFVAAALDPYGIDVEVAIETPDGERTTMGASSSTSSSSSSGASSMSTTTTEVKTTTKKTSETEEHPEQQQNKDLKEAAEAIVTDSEEALQSPTPSDDEEWTLLKDDKKEDTKEVEIPIQVSDKPAKVLFATPEGTLYPNLPTTEATPSAPVAVVSAQATQNTPATAVTAAAASVAAPTAPVVVASHPDPRIQVALQAMINMGFTNDGGWLTNLLEAKNGDIGQALDVLQPVRK